MSYSGKIFVIATPIGNLGDITLRALETLKNVDFILCEDTRTSGNLLRHYEISKELISLNAKNERGKIDWITGRIEKGESGALISDAGTPCISDPGIRLINSLIKNGIDIIGIPGANAALLALSINGLPTDSFLFEGFLPQKKGRQKKLKELAEEKRTLVLYESVHRIEKLLNEISEYMPDRTIVVNRELTKKFEESWRGTASEIIEQLPGKTIKGEFVVVISPIDWRE
ncbi:MAG: 16S rRNA (cytidine(1402)-2'-O)-methyltransferase [Melioribacteraceae bacterium]|nr:16S rRNA (cytidine(1402)-2'-O)-methyltransferase [Melioribacteraceae bacterium]MCF8353437.1 16S rRNA (cytidine(1402)-2'-O)-methyltransferase [Melioribacteraceae bacterium]MCF8393925.1 16S rRNA (cytidine(1402)-2'-O)-methyltransferase [Melioribacteraceae bacterium]MCF8418998.1 16S rRNA (cytidine(1402)-2'-O)-methyltransferase [Melioribacteraceae bacterium]